jgi:uncharacterized protein YgiM (DUF1202 family)
MKNSSWIILGALLSMNLSAQQATNTPPATTPEAPAAVSTATTNAPAATHKKQTKKTPAKKPAAKKNNAAAELRTVPLTAGAASVVASNVNVRGQAKLASEVVTRLNKGQSVTVLEEVVLKKSAPDEPSAWAKVLLPPGAHTWINAGFVETTNKTVVPKKLNVRSGPGENFSVIGALKRGDAVKEVKRNGEWMEIEAPADAFAFVAAQYLKQEAPAAAVEPPPVVAVNEPPPVAVASNTPPVETPPVVAPATETTPPAEVAPAPPEPRIVQREGIVRGTISIQAPTKFALISPDTGRTVNYLYTTSPFLDLRRYKGLKIVVTGEEGLDERWAHTPVITIQKIVVVE